MLEIRDLEKKVNIEDLVSNTLTYQEQSCTITGIVKTDIKYYDHCKYYFIYYSYYYK